MKSEYVSYVPSRAVEHLYQKFEDNWNGSLEDLRLFAEEPLIVESVEALTELVCIDIDRRNMQGMDIDRRVYLQIFPALNAPGPLRIIDGMLQRLADRSFGENSEIASRGERGFSSRFSSHAGEGPQANDLLAPGDQLGDFHIIALLGSGAFSRVYLAKQRALGNRHVVLKVVRRTLKEPDRLARLQHTNIVPLYSFHKHDGWSVLCMPYCGSTTLADWLNDAREASSRTGQSLVDTIQASRKQLTTWSAPGGTTANSNMETDREGSDARLLSMIQRLGQRKTALWLATRVTAGLAHAHLRGIVHGDLKPANVLIRNDGEPALIDFNLAHRVDCDEPALVGGTLAYMSPEQLEAMMGRETRRVAPSSDVYAFGVLLYQILEGKLPWVSPQSTAEVDIELALRMRSEQVPTMTSPHWTAGLKVIVRKCLEPMTPMRYPTAATLHADLEREADDRPLTVAKEPFWDGRFRKLLRRHPGWFAGRPLTLVAGMLAVVLAVSTFVWKSRSDTFSAKLAAARLDQESIRRIESLIDAAPQEHDAFVLEATQALQGWCASDSGLASEAYWLGRLTAAEQAAARRRIFEFCLSTVALACNGRQQLLPEQRPPLTGLMQQAAAFEDSTPQSLAFHRLAARWEFGDFTATQSSHEQPSAPPRNVFEKASPLEVTLAAIDLNNLEQFQRAEKLLLTLESMPQPSCLFWLTLGDAQQGLRQNENAILSYTRAIESAPQLHTPYSRRAAVHSALGHWQPAIDDYGRALERNPEAVASWADRAIALERAGDLRAAIADLSRALRLAPTSNRLMLMRSRLYRAAGDTEAAHSDYLRGLRAEPQALEDWVSRALARVSVSPQDALEDLRAAERLEPNSVVVQQNLAYVLSEHLDDPKSAIDSLDRIVQQLPTSEMALGGRCVLLARVGEFARSSRDIATLLRSYDHLRPSTLYQIACAYALAAASDPKAAEAALAMLARAAERGYGQTLLRTDPDLNPLRSSPKFKELVSSIDTLFTHGKRADQLVPTEPE